MKVNRSELFKKYNGKCAYCGCDLLKGWHSDHIEPIRRLVKSYTGPFGKRNFHVEGFMHPELETVENLNPSCASCNINKHGQSLDEFRAMITKFITSLNEYSVQYKIAKRYGLIKETGINVKFYFENVTKLTA